MTLCVVSRVQKAAAGDWKRLETQDSAAAVIQRENVVVNKMPAYPTSSKTGEKQWDTMEQEQKKVISTQRETLVLFRYISQN